VRHVFLDPTDEPTEPTGPSGTPEPTGSPQP
jgi:hypothetical protein